LEEPVNGLDQFGLERAGERVFRHYSKCCRRWKLSTVLVDSASGEQLQECINSPDETGDLARDDLMNSFVKADDPDLVGKLLRKLIDQWFS
jgi:hypothetical protein